MHVCRQPWLRDGYCVLACSVCVTVTCAVRKVAGRAVLPHGLPLQTVQDQGFCVILYVGKDVLVQLEASSRFYMIK